MATPDLEVRFGDATVGRLRTAETGEFCFAYSDSWLRSDKAFAISLSVPLREEEYVAGSAHAFFSNLLPEGAVRQAVCQRLGISEDNLGGHCKRVWISS